MKQYANANRVMEPRDHSKNGASPKSQTSRGNFQAICILYILFLAPFLTSLFAQENASVTIVNNTGYTIYRVYISQTASNSWGSDRLGSNQVLYNNQSVSLRLPYPLNVVNRYDIKLQDSDDDSYIKNNVPVSANSRIVFTLSDMNVGNTSTTSYNGPSITIVNNTGFTIYGVYISSNASDSWGSDRLASDQVLRDGQSISLRLQYAIDVVNRYDIRLKDSDGDTYTKMNVLVSANKRIEFTFSDYD